MISPEQLYYIVNVYPENIVDDETAKKAFDILPDTVKSYYVAMVNVIDRIYQQKNKGVDILCNGKVHYTRPIGHYDIQEVLTLINQGKAQGFKLRPTNCECDNTHEQNKTVCQHCFNIGLRFNTAWWKNNTETNVLDLVNPTVGVVFRARFIPLGDRYGVSCCLKNKEKPMVEIYDTRFNFTQHGQFIARYFVDTVLEHNDNTGLILLGNEPEWVLNPLNMKHLKLWLRNKMEGINE